ncbi:prepilin peptidase [Crassaminicella thermophila]|uniref:Prepilin leader peptidase/N-methyltransferase n=1 Tax=Crassaminicella thermophila TaxID=2599308 RepID=A0A5C0SDH3_CRATE|nr:A24 family peptidase [Crassaminicella thermophila]QEK12130.1 prepilin peptidase [Crassaminicella thermophila]
MQFIILLLGLLIGSFLNVCIFRIPRGESIVYPSSHCLKCNTPLKSIDLVPVFSYLIYRGKCRYCGAKLSIQYPTIELMNAIIYMLLYYKFGCTFDFLQYTILASLLIVISLIDFYHQIIPDGLIMFGLIVTFLLKIPLLVKDFTLIYNYLIGLLLGGGFFLLLAIITNGAMGGGDIKLMGLLGLWLGWKWILLIMFLSFFLGSIISILLMISKKKGRKDMIPFAPFIGLAVLMTVCYGNDIIYYYMLFL